MVLLSAHRCGAGRDRQRENTWEALLEAIKMQVEYVEFDVQRLRDGTLVLFHDPRVRANNVEYSLASLNFERFSSLTHSFLLYEDVLKKLAEAGKKAHIDFKFTSPQELYHTSQAFEVEAARLAVEHLGLGNFIITTLEDESVRSLTTWAKNENAHILIGLSFGRHGDGLSFPGSFVRLWSELFPHRRVVKCGANLMVAHRLLARASLARYAQRNRMPLLVWTVDSPRELLYWLRSERAWLVTSNYPRQALSLRELLNFSQAS